LEEVCLQQGEILTELCALCNQLIKELAQYKCIEAEEERLNNLTKEVNVYGSIVG